jgi:hypothetical protein
MSMSLKRAEKDLLMSLVFVIFIYTITHNPITHPKPKPVAGDWTIEFVQHPLVFGILGHNYLVMKNANEETESEMHGLATDRNTKTWKYIGRTSNDMLHVWEFNDRRYGPKSENFAGVVVATGTADEIKSLWSNAEECAKIINQKDIPYTPYGFSFRYAIDNSNSVATTLLTCMNIDPVHLGLITPGENTNLLDGY